MLGIFLQIKGNCIIDENAFMLEEAEDMECNVKMSIRLNKGQL